jgi:hypothetical protein
LFTFGSGIIKVWMAGTASNTFFYLPFISLAWLPVFYPKFRSAKMHMEGTIKHRL